MGKNSMTCTRQVKSKVHVVLEENVASKYYHFETKDRIFFFN